jgi:hypothetical protein
MDEQNEDSHQVGMSSSSKSHPASAGRPIGSGVGNHPKGGQRKQLSRSNRKGDKEEPKSSTPKDRPPIPSKGKVKPSVKLYRDRRAAFRLRERLGSVPADKLTIKDRESLDWAESILKERDSTKPRETLKRKQRSLDETPKAALKRPCRKSTPVNPARSFSDIVKSHYIWAVIDRGHPDGSITATNWRRVEMALTTAYLGVLQRNPGTPPQCLNAGWHQGHIKLTACADQRSADLYKQAVSELGELWPGAQIEVVAREDIPSRPRSRTWIPAEPSDPDTITKIIQVSNPALPTEDWRVVKVGEVEGLQRHAVVVVNDASLPLLRNTGGVISYGFSSITLQVYKKDLMAAHNEGNAPPTEESDPQDGAIREETAEPERMEETQSSGTDDNDTTVVEKSEEALLHGSNGESSEGAAD